MMMQTLYSVASPMLMQPVRSENDSAELNLQVA